MLTLDTAKAALVADGVPEKTIDAFFRAHQLNPRIWEFFERFCLDAIELNRRVGAKAVMERVRWEVQMKLGDEFKVNNNFTAYYVRMFQLKHPAFKHFFETRTVRGLQEA